MAMHASIQTATPYHTDLMKSCYTSCVPNMAIFENEIIAMDGWYQRTMETIDQGQALAGASEKASYNCEPIHKTRALWSAIRKSRSNSSTQKHTFQSCTQNIQCTHTSLAPPQ